MRSKWHVARTRCELGPRKSSMRQQMAEETCKYTLSAERASWQLQLQQHQSRSDRAALQEREKGRIRRMVGLVLGLGNPHHRVGWCSNAITDPALKTYTSCTDFSISCAGDCRATLSQ